MQKIFWLEIKDHDDVAQNEEGRETEISLHAIRSQKMHELFHKIFFQEGRNVRRHLIQISKPM